MVFLKRISKGALPPVLRVTVIAAKSAADEVQPICLLTVAVAVS